MKLAFELEVPDGAVDQSAEAELVRSVKEQTVLKLYSEGRVTTGEAAQMLAWTRIAFLDLLRRTGVGFHVELDEEDFEMLRQWCQDRSIAISQRARQLLRRRDGFTKKCGEADSCRGNRPNSRSHENIASCSLG
jgi:predicted HTH domain antitoxin